MVKINEFETVIINPENKPLFDNGFITADYLKANIETAVQDLISQMITDELSGIGFGSKRRELALKRINAKQQKAVRQRLKEGENVIPKIELSFYNEETGKYEKSDPIKLTIRELFDLSEKQRNFAKSFSKACKELTGRGEKLNKTNIAKVLFSNDSNQLQSLRRNLKELNLNFNDVLFAYMQSEQISLK